MGSAFQSTSSGLAGGDLDALVMEAAPIPADWILAGAPVARSAPFATSDDGLAVSTVWDCTAGTFRWPFHWEETVIILRGEVRVTDPQGGEKWLAQGSTCHFPAGVPSVWTIPAYVRKIAFCRRPLPAEARRWVDLRDRGLALLSRGRQALAGRHYSS